MQPSVPSHILRSLRPLALALVATIVVAGLPGEARAFSPSPQAPPIVTNLTAAATSPTTAEVTADVTSNGGAPPIWSRGFVYSLASEPLDPELGGPGVSQINVPGQPNGFMLGAMTRTIAGLTPGLGYAVQAFAVNSQGPAYSGVATFITPCPLITLAPLPNYWVGANYSHSVDAAPGSGVGFTHLVTAGSLPPGLSLDPGTGVLSGTPLVGGNFPPFTITATDNLWPCGGSRLYNMVIDAYDVSPRKLAFASEQVGVTSPGKTVSITRAGGGPITLIGLNFSAPQYSIASTTCGGLPIILVDGGSCTLTIDYTPDSPAAHPATLTINHLGTGPPIVISLSGVGTVVPEPQLFVSNTYDQSVSVIDPVTNLVRKTIPVGLYPANLSGANLPVVGGKVFVPNEGGYSVSVISTDTNDPVVTATVVDASLNGPSAVAFTPTGNEAWVVNSYSPDYAITVIRTLDNVVLTSIPNTASFGCLTGARGIVANPMTTEMYTIGGFPGRVCVFDRLTKAFLRRIDVGGSPYFGLVLPNGSALYINSAGPNPWTAARIDLPLGTLTLIPGGEGTNMDVKADGSKIYMGRNDGFGFIDTTTNTFTPIPLTDAGNPFGVAVNEARGRVYVTDFYTYVVHAVSLATDTEMLSPGLPIQDPALYTPQAITEIGSVVTNPPGAIPGLSGASVTPHAFSADVAAVVTLGAGDPLVFSRGFYYSETATEPDPLPGRAGVSTRMVPGTLGPGPASAPIATTLTGLTSGVTYSFRAFASNFLGTGTSAVSTFTTNAVTCPAITVTPAVLPNGLTGVPYAGTTLTASGGTGPYSYLVSGGPLPPGLTLSGATISGTPTALGEYLVTFTATDTATECFTQMSYTLFVGTAVAAGDVVISEFRTRGVNGAQDDYVELANRTTADIVVAAEDGSQGWSIGIAPGVRAVVVPNGTVIEKGGHWLAATGLFSLSSYGSPDPVYSGDQNLQVDLPDDRGLALFNTATPAQYSLARRLDAVGTVIETDPLFYEGTPDPLPANDTRLVEVIQAGPVDPTAQTAWVRRMTNSGVLTDSGNNAWDFTFVATDAGAYGPSGNVLAVLGAPNPEDSYAVRDALQSELPASLLDPAQGQDRQPNREVSCCTRIDYRRRFTNNTGKEITVLAFKIIDLTTVHSVTTLSRRQAELTAVSAPDVLLEVPTGSNNFVPVIGTDVDYPAMYQFGGCCEPRGGLNSRVIAQLGGPPVAVDAPRPLSPVFAGESVVVNIRARVWNPGYYIFVIMPQVSFEPLGCGSCASPTGTTRKPRRERGGTRPPEGTRAVPIDPRGLTEVRPER